MKKSLLIVMIGLFCSFWIESASAGFWAELSAIVKKFGSHLSEQERGRIDFARILAANSKNREFAERMQAAFAGLSNDDRVIVDNWLKSKTVEPGLQDDPIIKMVDKAYQQARANATNSPEEREAKVNEAFRKAASAESAFTFEMPCTIKINHALYTSRVLKVAYPAFNCVAIGKTVAALAVCEAYDCVEKALGGEPRPIRKKGEVFSDRLADGMEGPYMVAIPGGEFWMGSEEGEKGYDSWDRHWVKVKSFAIGQYEVTFQEYDRFCEATGREKPGDEGWGRGRRPVIFVSWHDALAYADWLSHETGERYRLPTEAEWEYAARANTETAYWWGNEIGCNNANYGNCGSSKTAVVDAFNANKFGLYNTAGNVWEWTCSAFRNYKGEEMECANKDDESWRVFRGGSFVDGARQLRSAYRSGNPPSGRFGSVGFRLAQDL